MLWPVSTASKPVTAVPWNMLLKNARKKPLPMDRKAERRWIQTVLSFCHRCYCRCSNQSDGSKRRVICGKNRFETQSPYCASGRNNVETCGKMYFVPSCVSKCPSHVIKPAFTVWLGGMMQPHIWSWFCNYDCTVCWWSVLQEHSGPHCRTKHHIQ